MKIILIVAGFFGCFTHGKIYDRCELARELKYVHNAPDHQLGTWVCIAEHESQYNTSIVGYLSGDGSGDHGIFQISDQFWCSPPGKGYACGLTCADLEDDDITDDFQCARKIYKEHKQLSGDGFNAWAVYKPHCKGIKANRYIKDCFNDFEEPKTYTTSTSSFAHGFFDSAAGGSNKGFSPSKKISFQPVFSLKPPAIVHNQFSFISEKPATSSSTFPSNQFFTSTEVPNFNLFFTPTTTTTFKPILTITSTFKPITTKRQNLLILNPSTTISPVVSTPIFNFNTPSKVYAPSTSVLQTSSKNYPAPVFIINGVSWL